ncbi:variant erythrocyte surface antigen-1 family protein [Babesia caballi]|uniref:Variant erythrocyte surface antigen-1 family protein n=1 Tax=Babesia caballi TaxID=5871 RepID=A0AAV4LUF1_BABCB|nr:variant erythrocyte surface antigen-1 family protein [Babesia caballi]
MSPDQKSLTEAPQDLKEAIDWVLRVTAGDLGPVINTSNLIISLGGIQSETSHSHEFLNNVLNKIISGRGSYATGPLTAVATGLQKIIGYEYVNGDQRGKGTWKISDSGILKSGVISANGLPTASAPNGIYTSAYSGSQWAEVLSTVENANRITIQNFFTSIQLIFEGLTELYVKCKTEWYSQSLGANSELKQFMEKNGFSGTQLNASMTGNQIISQAFKDLKEFDTAYGVAGKNPSLDAFRSELEQSAWSNPYEYPLSALYILATYAYVRSTSPASPSFAGYSGPAALAGGAYGLNLGGLGSLMSALLA